MRRALGTPDGQPEVEVWLRPRAYARGYDVATVDKVWEVLKAFASFGFCKAHAAAFALPTYQSAWLKAHHPAAFLAGVLTHDPGMYPKRLILDDARQFGIAVLPLDVNASDAHLPGRAGRSGSSRAEERRAAGRRLAAGRGLRHPARAGRRQGHLRGRGRPDRRRPALRLAGRLLAPGRRCPARSSSGWCSPAPSTPSTRWGRRSPGRPAGRAG